MKVFLFIIVNLLALVIIPIGVVYSSIYGTIKGTFADWSWTQLKSIDQFAGVSLAPFWNMILLNRYAESRFGDNEDETMSSVLGKNKRDSKPCFCDIKHDGKVTRTRTLTWAGLILCWLLNTIDKNHVEKSIEE